MKQRSHEYSQNSGALYSCGSHESSHTLCTRLHCSSSLLLPRSFIALLGAGVCMGTAFRNVRAPAGLGLYPFLFLPSVAHETVRLLRRPEGDSALFPAPVRLDMHTWFTLNALRVKWDDGVSETGLDYLQDLCVYTSWPVKRDVMCCRREVHGVRAFVPSTVVVVATVRTENRLPWLLFALKAFARLPCDVPRSVSPRIHARC